MDLNIYMNCFVLCGLAKRKLLNLSVFYTSYSLNTNAFTSSVLGKTCVSFTDIN